jgi:hypothetical protein
MGLLQLLEQQGIDLSALDLAPATVTRRESGDRIRRLPPWPCVLCGAMSPTAWVVDAPGLGPRWVELCSTHAVEAGQSGLPWNRQR